MKRRLVALLAGSLWAASALAQPYGMGPGMMGSDGRGGYGPGGCDTGPGMMWGGGGGPGYGGGYGGGYGMGPGGGMGQGMMGGFGRLGLRGLDLTDEQRSKLAEIHADVDRKQWDLMRSMHELGWQMGGKRGGAFDEAQARKTYDAMAALRKQMFDNALDAHQRIDAVLTPAQRQQVRRGWGGQ